MKILLTFDVEIWCDGWQDIDLKFPAAFDRYIYGHSKKYGFALPRIIDILNAHDLKATFFVEPLFASRFGLTPLTEIVKLICAGGQDVQLHLHPEWTDEANPPFLPNAITKRQHLNYYNLEEQTTLIAKGKELLSAAGAPNIYSFRAGSFACNINTFKALRANGIRYDSSLNMSIPISAPDLRITHKFYHPFLIEGVCAVPMTVFMQFGGTLRHAQIGACSFAEIKYLIQEASQTGVGYFVLLSHNFEMLKLGKTIPDSIVVNRFFSLCQFLDKNRDKFPLITFREIDVENFADVYVELRVPFSLTLLRIIEQGYRRLYS